jgi:hypothetical protein
MQAPKKQRWYVQIKETYKFASNEISFLALRLLGVFAVVFGIIFAIGVAVDLTAFFGVFAFGTALLATTFFFGKIAENAAYSSIAGQVGAAASVLNAIRGAWFVTPAVGVDKNQNMVHRVVGRPGIILVGEGSVLQFFWQSSAKLTPVTPKACQFTKSSLTMLMSRFQTCKRLLRNLARPFAQLKLLK